ncbi:MAG TPA: hypothetical protein PK971_00280 [Saprospiraceae bacterium]|nr:hypothetical protein [Saprospiraceae bacterium]HNG88815.1 hypothetical protein [Saprospiraceae bacterium]
MEALEFSTKIENGLIRLPHRYRMYEDAFVRVIVLASKPQVILKRKRNLAEVFNKMKDKEMFARIDDAALWQKKLRNEWQ